MSLRLGLPVIAYGALAGGILTGKYLDPERCDLTKPRVCASRLTLDFCICLDACLPLITWRGSPHICIKRRSKQEYSSVHACTQVKGLAPAPIMHAFA